MTTLGDILAGAVPFSGEPSAAERDLARRQHEQAHADQDAQHRMVSHFAAILCSCRPWYEPGDTSPPQLGCVVHGQVMVNPCSGAVYLPGMPPPDHADHG